MRLLLVDDSVAFLEAARLLLAADGYDIVGTAVDGAAAIQLAVALQPQVVVVDVGLPDISGFHVARQLSNLPAPPSVVLVSSHDWSDRPARVQTSGACGFIAKDQLDGAAIEALTVGSP